MRVAVGLSGGVDSAVAALLCKLEGHEVLGVLSFVCPRKREQFKKGLTRLARVLYLSIPRCSSLFKVFAPTDKVFQHTSQEDRLSG